MSIQHREAIIRCANGECIVGLLEGVHRSIGEPLDMAALVPALRARLQERRHELIGYCQEETGMSVADATESIEGCFALMERFDPLASDAVTACPAFGARKLEIRSAPWGVVLAILPRNAYLVLALSCLLHALKAGNAVVLRVPSGQMGTAEALASCFPECGRVAFVRCDAGLLVQEFCASPVPGLIHYFGGSSRVGELLRTTFESGKALIADGEGNAWVYVDESANVEAAAELLTAGSTRYGGRTCTSINGAIIHPAVYEAVADRLVTRFQQLSPVLFEDPAEALAAMARATESGGKVLTGGHPHASEAPPTLVANPDEASLLVRHGVFGPVLWICAGDAVEFRRRWPRNRFPLCAAVIAREVDVDSWASLGNLARLVVNGDPSLEDPIEPWGGYPSTGNNPVSGWYEKYRRSVQVDSP